MRTFCRICEVYCGLVAEVDDGRVLALRPDRDHPVSRGYACVKGLGLGALHDDPHRLDHPLKRVGDVYQRISWDQAITEIGARVRTLVDAHGPRAVALYQGNPTFFSFQAVLMSSAFVEALGSPNVFASHSVDTNNKFHVSTAMYGLSLVHPVPDLDRMRFLMCLGTNPTVSQMSVLQVADATAALRGIVDRGGRVVMVDPRRSETVRKVGEHVPIRPGTDAYLLAAMLHVLTAELGADVDRVRAVASGVDEVLAVVAPWSPERATAVTGIPAETIRELATAYATAEGAALYMSTGVNMGPFGSVAYWLLQCLNLISGNLDRAGGLLVPEGAFDVLRLSAALGLGTFDEHRTTDGRWHRVAGAFPVAALADEITTDHPDRVRALFVTAGNPVHSVPDGSRRLVEAMRRLDLVVSIDLYRNETAALADYVLPATDMLERSDFTITHQVLQVVPHVQWTPAVVPPAHERREEWRTFADLAEASGTPLLGATAANALPRLNRLLRRLPGRPELTPDRLIALLLRWGRRTSMRELRRHPEGVLLPRSEPGTFLGRRVRTADGLVHLAPPELVADAARLGELEAELSRTDVLRLVGRRDRRSHNSWMHGNPRISQPAGGNTVLLHPQDAVERGIAEGDTIEVSSPTGSVRLPCSLTEDVARGVVVVPHGWGHATSGHPRARSLPGANVNDVIPGGPAHMDPVSGQAVMLAHAVEVRRVLVGDDTPTPDEALPA